MVIQAILHTFVEQIHILRFVIVGGSVVESYPGGQGLIPVLTEQPCQPQSHQNRLTGVFDGGGKVCVLDMMEEEPPGSHDKYDMPLYLPMLNQFQSDRAAGTKHPSV